MLNGFKFLKHFESKTSQFELLAHFDTQFIVNESFKLKLAYKS